MWMMKETKFLNINKMEEIEITFYLNEKEITENNPRGVIAASFMDDWGEVRQHCTADIRIRDENILIAFSSGEKNKMLLDSLNMCIEIDGYRVVTCNLNCRIVRSYPHYLIIKKTDIDLWKK